MLRSEPNRRDDLRRTGRRAPRSPLPFEFGCPSQSSAPDQNGPARRGGGRTFLGMRARFVSPLCREGSTLLRRDVLDIIVCRADEMAGRRLHQMGCSADEGGEEARAHGASATLGGAGRRWTREDRQPRHVPAALGVCTRSSWGRPCQAAGDPPFSNESEH